MIQKVKEFVSKNKKLILLVLLLLLGFILVNSINTGFHKKEIKALEAEIKAKEEDFQEVMDEKAKLQDSSMLYELAAEQASRQAASFKAKAEQQRKAKEEALAALRSIPKEVIDSFFVKRYEKVNKVGVDLALDQNIGNAVVVELTEKDHLVGELATAKDENGSLTTQVTSLQTSLNFSKAALVKADSAISIRSQQLDLSKQANDLLKKDLSAAKKKAFWNQWKGAGVGIAAGLVVGLLAK